MILDPEEWLPQGNVFPWWSGDGVDVCRLYVDDSYPSSANPNLTALRSSIRRPFVPKVLSHLNLSFRLQKRALERVG